MLSWTSLDTPRTLIASWASSLGTVAGNETLRARQQNGMSFMTGFSAHGNCHCGNHIRPFEEIYVKSNLYTIENDFGLFCNSGHIMNNNDTLHQH